MPNVHLRQLDEDMLVAGQLQPAEIEGLAGRVALIVNNRPDGEQPGQPSNAEMAAAAEAAGIEYRHIPISGGFSEAQVEEMAGLLDAAKGTALAFCASGTRSTFLWALARASKGIDGRELTEKAAAVGYDLSPIRPYLSGSCG
ncbi:MAG: TIGR01244 family phosphatase [Sphingosinicella sp.]|nr:TIGR01244 family phosphatase [Sphingosinicella sp.]